MELHAYEMLLNDMYQHLIDPKNAPAKGTNMIKYSKEFIEGKKYYDEFLFEMNMDEKLRYDFKRELEIMIKIIKCKHEKLNSANDQELIIKPSASFIF